MEILVLHELRHDLPSLAREQKAEVGANPSWTGRRMVHDRSHRPRSPTARIHADRRGGGWQSRTAEAGDGWWALQPHDRGRPCHCSDGLPAQARSVDVHPATPARLISMAVNTPILSSHFQSSM